MPVNQTCPMKFEQLSRAPTASNGRRHRARSSLLRLSLSRITANRQQPRRGPKKWIWNCLRRSLSTKAVFLLLCLLVTRLLVHHADALLALVRHPTEPTTFFKTCRMGDKEILLRSWRKPYVFTAYGDETKRFIRSQPISALQRAPRPSA